jgi:hypothetical protein
MQKKNLLDSFFALKNNLKCNRLTRKIDYYI